jgi:hypothetical protein
MEIQSNREKLISGIHAELLAPGTPRSRARADAEEKFKRLERGDLNTEQVSKSETCLCYVLSAGLRALKDEAGTE